MEIIRLDSKQVGVNMRNWIDSAQDMVHWMGYVARMGEGRRRSFNILANTSKGWRTRITRRR